MPISLADGPLALVEEAVKGASSGILRVSGETNLTGVTEKSLITPTRGGDRFPLNPGRTLVIKGALQALEDLAIEGTVEGTIDLHGHTIAIGVQGQISGNVYADSVVVFGTVKGNIYAADHVEIRRTAVVLGDLTAARVVIEDGAYFKGSIDIRRRTEIEAQGSKLMKLLFKHPVSSEQLSRFHELIDKELKKVLAPSEVEELRNIKDLMEEQDKRLIGAYDTAHLENHLRITNRLDGLIAELKSISAGSSKS